MQQPLNLAFLMLALLAVILVSGCGQKGDLYLPQPETKLTHDLRAL